MIRIALAFLVIVATTPLLSQVEPAARGGGFDLDDTHMMTPPPVSSDAYPVIVGTEERSNYFDAGMVFTGSYVDNLMLGPTKVSDEIYYIVPSVSFNRRTPRHGESFHYNPGFTIYQNTSQLNGVSQDASGDYRFHISPYAVIQIGERFQQNYNLYNQSNPFILTGVSGTPRSPNTVLIAPFANQVINTSSAGLNYQYGRNAMVGGSAYYSLLRYPATSQFTGLNNGNTTGATGFYSRRVAPAEYVGIAYQFSKFVTHPVDTYTLTHNVFGFYTHYFNRSFSFSILGGPEHYSTWARTVSKKEAWAPAVQGSLGFQTLRTSMGVGFTHIVSGAAGLNGAFHANMGNLTGRLAFRRSWNAGASAEYSVLNSVNSGLYPGGRTISVGADLEHQIAEKITVAAGYGHVHEGYTQVPIAAFSPDSNRVYFSINYGFHRPLGR